MAFANEEEQSPGLNSGQHERGHADEGDEAAGGLRSPLLHHEALLGHRDVLVLPHSAREQQAFPSEVLSIFRKRHYRDKSEDESQKIQDALREYKIVFCHFHPARAQAADHRCRACAVPLFVRTEERTEHVKKNNKKIKKT